MLQLPPNSIKLLVECFLIPVGLLLCSSLVKGEFNLKHGTSTDLFILLLSADMEALINYIPLSGRIPETSRQNYLTTFVFLLLVSLVFVAISFYTERKLRAWKRAEVIKQSRQENARSPLKPPVPVPADTPAASDSAPSQVPPSPSSGLSTSQAATGYPSWLQFSSWFAALTLLPTHFFLFYAYVVRP
jgi:hypothetical protein